MKYVNYLFLFVAFIFSTSVFAQQAGQQAEVLSLSVGSLEEYDYKGDALIFLFPNRRARSTCSWH